MATIRPAVLSDAKALSIFAERTFRETFATDNSAENINAYCRANHAEAIQASDIVNPDCLLLVAEDHQQLIAYTQLTWGEPPACVLANTPGEIQRLYVDHHWHGTGLASELMVAGLNALDKRGTDVAWLGVWEKNPRAIAFYKKFNFIEVGEQRFHLGSDPQRDVIMALNRGSNKMA